MKNIILFRKDQNTQHEFEVASKYVKVTESRVDLENKEVVGRYSVLPFYEELERDLNHQGSTLINSWSQHKYIANFDYYKDIKDFTFKTYFSLEEMPKDGGPFVIKGRTNSRKFEWSKKMFVKNSEEATNLWCELTVEDPLIRDQGAIIREYVPLRVLDHGLNDLPFSNEWRLFYLDKEMIMSGFYWNQVDPPYATLPYEAKQFADSVAKRIEVPFFVIDIAETKQGDWIVIELNDGQMSGLSTIDPELFYQTLRNHFLLRGLR